MDGVNELDSISWKQLLGMDHTSSNLYIVTT